MKTLNIDPGNEFSAYCIWDGSHIVDFGKVQNQELLNKIRECFREQTDRCVIELIGHYGKGMPAGKSVFETCIATGRLGERYGWERVDLVLRPTVKTHLCGSAKAKDGNVIQALKDRFGGKGTKKAPGFFFGVSADSWQAIALAVCWWDQEAWRYFDGGLGQ